MSQVDLSTYRSYKGLSWALVGPTLAVAVLVVIGVLSRGVIVYRAVRRWWMPGR